MNKGKVIFVIAFNRIGQWIKSKHILIFFFYVWFLCDIYLRPMLGFIKAVHVDASPYGFIFLLNQTDFVLLFFLGIVFAFGDVPFIDKATKYTVLRTGVGKWINAQICYIWICSGLFMLMSGVISIFPLAKYISYQQGWGKVYGTLAQTSAGQDFLLAFKPDYQIMLDYTPFEAIVYVFLIGSLLICLIGKILFLFSLWYEKIIGIFITLGFIFFSVAAEFLSGYKANFVSPISWIRLSRLTEFRGNGLPTLHDAIGILLILHLFISIVILWNKNRKDFLC